MQTLVADQEIIQMLNFNISDEQRRNCYLTDSFVVTHGVLNGIAVI